MARAKKTSSSSRKQTRQPKKKNIESRLKTVKKRQKSQKTKLLEELEQTPIIEAMLQKVGISKSTYYRWRENKNFHDKCEESLAKGRERINDMAEKNVMQGIHKGDAQMTKFWLRHNSKRYGAKHTYDIFIHDVTDEGIPPERLAEIARSVHEWKKKCPKVRMTQKEMDEMLVPREDDLKEPD